jgi:hypothetical protein
MQHIVSRLMLSLACVVGLAACDQEEDLGAKQLTFQEEALEPATALEGATELDASLLESEPYSNANACKWHCKPCPPNKLCTQECYEIGNCNSECGIIAKCIAGYVWSDQACNCIPDPNFGEACGSVTCPSGTECCNASCGICVEPGNFCTQQACTEL